MTSGVNKLFILICLLRTCLFRRYPILQYALETRYPAFHKMGFHLKGFSWNERHLSTIRLPDDFFIRSFINNLSNIFRLYFVRLILNTTNTSKTTTKRWTITIPLFTFQCLIWLWVYSLQTWIIRLLGILSGSKALNWYRQAYCLLCYLIISEQFWGGLLIFLSSKHHSTINMSEFNRTFKDDVSLSESQDSKKSRWWELLG